MSLSLFGLYRLNSLNTTPLDADNFSWINKVEIYSLGILMSVIAYPIYPEVAREQLMMYRPFSKEPEVIEDDFFLKSKVVQSAIEKSRELKKTYRLAWPVSAYPLSMDWDKYQEARIALKPGSGLDS